MNSNTGSDLGGCSAGGLKKKKKHRLWVNQFIKQYDCKYSSGEGKKRTEPKHMLRQERRNAEITLSQLN